MNKRMLLAIVAGLSICELSSAAPPDARPKVQVTFVIEPSESEKTGIEPAGIRTNLKDLLTATIADVQDGVRADLQTRFPYFEWVTAGPATHTLTLTLREVQGPLDVHHELVYTASISDGNPRVHVIFPVEEPPGDDAVPLRSDIVTKVRADVARSEAELKRYFTMHVPLVKRVDIEGKSILLPVADVHPERALFLVDFSDAAANRGTIRLFRPQDQPPGVYCEIEVFQFLPEIPQTPWHNRIPTVLRTEVQRVEVKVLDFTPRPFANTSGGSVTSLGDTR